MALAFVDGFDHYNIADLDKKWTSIGSDAGCTSSMDTGRISGQSLKQERVTNGQAEWMMKTYLASATQGAIGFAFKSTAYTYETSYKQRADMSIAAIISGGETNWFLVLGGDGSLSIYTRGGIYGFIFGGVLYLTCGSISLNTWHYIEWQWNFTTHTMLLHQDGVTIGSITDASVAGTFNAVELLGAAPYGTGYHFNGTLWVDDVYALAGTTGQTALYGDVGIKVRLVENNGTTNQGVASAGDQHSCVDESLADVADYVTLDDVNEIETYQVEDMPGDSEIKGIQVTALAKKTVDGAALVASEIRHSGAEYTHPTSQGLNTNFRFQMFPHENDPSDTPWTPTTFNAAEFGVKKTG